MTSGTSPKRRSHRHGSLLFFLALGAFFVFAAGGAAWAQGTPVVTNVSAAQRADISKLVDIRYDLAASGPCAVWVVVSGDGGATWTILPTALSGHAGLSVAPGLNRHIVWNCPLDLPGAFGSSFKVRVCAVPASGPGNMALIPAGEFLMGDTFNEGSTNERPVHAVYVDAFYMDRYEVTNEQYAAALNWALAQGNLITVTNGVVYKFNSGTSFPYCDTDSSSSFSRITFNGTSFGVVAGKENHPMVRVSWYGAAAYANWRSGMEGRQPAYDTTTWECNFAASGYRLPTEAEWEKAARGGASGRRFPWADGDTIQHARANYYSWSGYAYDTSLTRNYHPLWGVGSFHYTSPVGFFSGALQHKADWGWPGAATSYQTVSGANGYGLYDMAGNAWEWCNDWLNSTYYSTSPYANPRGPTSGTYRVVRGGSWYSIAYYLRCAYRGSYNPNVRSNGFGFRLALDAN